MDLAAAARHILLKALVWELHLQAVALAVEMRLT
jgi:hypothetical protein